jgi:hypothetical protein
MGKRTIGVDGRAFPVNGERPFSCSWKRNQS